MSNQSLADVLVAAIADIKQVEAASDDPMRFAVRYMKQQAETILFEAASQATALALTAKMIQEDHAKAVDEVRKGGAA
ncbi:hypothetical protein [Chromobacterium sp.]|uniref:hypothetical protein n=1 Tax=Chromobacterium sp. TaxID=306190 RepID=UPI0035AF2488